MNSPITKICYIILFLCFIAIITLIVLLAKCKSTSNFKNIAGRQTCTIGDDPVRLVTCNFDWRNMYSDPECKNQINFGPNREGPFHPLTNFTDIPDTFYLKNERKSLLNNKDFTCVKATKHGQDITTSTYPDEAESVVNCSGGKLDQGWC